MQNILDTYLDPNNKGYTYEFNRLVNTAKKSNLFAAKKYFHRAVLPKSFDRVFTVFVDEGDFIPVQSFDSSTSAADIAETLDNTFHNVTAQGGILKKNGEAHTIGVTLEELQGGSSTSSIFNETEGFTTEKLYQYYCDIKLVDTNSSDSSFSIVSYLESDSSRINSDTDFITIFDNEQD
jgi:hypothetical protein